MEKPQFSISVFERAERILYCKQNRLVLNSWIHPVWSTEGDTFWYIRETADGKEFVLVDANSGVIRPAFDHERLARELIKQGIKADPSRLPFDSFQTDGPGIIHLRIGENEVRCDLEDYTCEIREVADLPTSWNLSPDGSAAVFVEANDLFVRNRRTGSEIRLTSDGKELFDYATGLDAEEKVMNNRIRGTRLPPIVSWSPSCSKIITHRIDQRSVREVYSLETRPSDRPITTVHKFRWAYAGDKNVPLVEYFIFDVTTGQRVRVELPPMGITGASAVESQLVWWTKDGKRLLLLQRDRGDKQVVLYSIDSTTGDARAVFEERSKTHVDFGFRAGVPNIRLLNDGNEILWLSNRDGWGHLYLIDGDGTIKNRVTSGEWLVRDIVFLDENRRQVYFTASGREPGREPYYRHLYRINLAGNNLQLLTPEDADHTVSVSPNGGCFVDTVLEGEYQIDVGAEKVGW